MDWSLRSGASAAVVEQFTSAAGGSRIFWEPLGTETQKYAVEQVLGPGLDTVPTYNLENAKTIILGADSQRMGMSSRTPRMGR